MKDYTEDALVEQPAIALLKQMGWQHINCFTETFGESGTLGRETEGEVVLVTTSPRRAGRSSTPAPPPMRSNRPSSRLTRDRSTMSLAARQPRGLPPAQERRQGPRPRRCGQRARRDRPRHQLEHPGNNDFLLVSQLWVAGDMYHPPPRSRRLRQRHAAASSSSSRPPIARLEHAYQGQPPRLQRHHPAALLVQRPHPPLQRQREPRRHPHRWLGAFLRVEENQRARAKPGVVSLETVLRGTCDQTRLLDLVENFTLFDESERRAHQDRRPEPPVSRRQQRPRCCPRHPARTRAGSACSGTPRAAAKASRWCSSPRRCCASCPATGPSWSSPTARNWTTRSTRTSPPRAPSPSKSGMSRPTAATI